MALQPSLSDRHELASGRIVLTGVAESIRDHDPAKARSVEQTRNRERHLLAQPTRMPLALAAE